MEKQVSTADINIYGVQKGGAILFNAVSAGIKGSGIFREGAYIQERIFSEILDFVGVCKAEEIYLRSFPVEEQFGLFRKVDNSFLSQLGDSLRETGIEAKVVLN